jgi:DNA polymerase-1
MGEKVRKGKDMALLSKKLATIIIDAPVEFHVEDFKLKDWDKEKLKEIFPSWNLKHWAKDCWAMNFQWPQPEMIL